VSLIPAPGTSALELTVLGLSTSQITVSGANTFLRNKKLSKSKELDNGISSVLEQ